MDGVCVFVTQEKGYIYWPLFGMLFLSWLISAFLLADVIKVLLLLHRRVMVFPSEASGKSPYCSQSGHSNDLLTPIKLCISPNFTKILHPYTFDTTSPDFTCILHLSTFVNYHILAKNIHSHRCPSASKQATIWRPSTKILFFLGFFPLLFL